MGVIHKLKPEVIKFILDNKQANPNLSCRSLAELLLEKLQVEVSKSSINAIFKQHSLSMPVGRRRKQKKKKFNMPVLPVIENIGREIPQEGPSAAASKDNTPSVAGKNPIVSGQEQNQMDSEDERVKEAEGWAENLLKKEHERLEHERLAQKDAQSNPREDSIGDDLLKLKKLQEEEEKKKEYSLKEEEGRSLKTEGDLSGGEGEKLAGEKEALLKAEEEKLRQIKAQEETQRQAEEERLAKEREEAEFKEKEARIKEEEERLAREKEDSELREKEALLKAEEEKLRQIKAQEETQRQAEEERLAREAELKAEKERWIRLSEDENKSIEPVKPVHVEKKEGSYPVTANDLSLECTGLMLLRAVDYLVKGSAQLLEVIQRRLGCPKEEADALVQDLVFRKLLGGQPQGMNFITHNEISRDKLDSYFSQMQAVKTLKLDLSRLLANIFTEIRGIKMHFIDGSVVYLDAQMHTVWPTPYVSYDFSAAVPVVKDCINRYLFRDGNLVLFMAPGYDIPTQELFTILLKFNSSDETADNLILYGNKLDELENVSLNPDDPHNLSFALWPWQFTAYRKIKKIGVFSPQYIRCLDRELYLAEADVELVQPASMQSFALKGCAVKLNPDEKIRLIILTTDNSKSLLSMANDYLQRWPNFDEGLHDFNRKIELFNCTGESHPVFSYEELPMGRVEPPDLQSIFSGYTEVLDAYLRWRFMPSGYEKTEYNITLERFYSQKGRLTQSKDKISCFLDASADYAYAKDLEYICRRLNERDIYSDEGKRIHFESGFK